MNKNQRRLLIASCIVFACIFHLAFFDLGSRELKHIVEFGLKVIVPAAFLVAAAFLYLGKPKFWSPPLEDYLDQLKNEDKNVRALSIKALTDVEAAPEVAVPALLTSLKDADEEVRVQAARALASYGPRAKAAVGALIEALRDQAPLVRSRAARALGKIGLDAFRAVEALKQSLKDEDELVRLYATEALTRIQGTALEDDPKSSH